MVSKHIVNFLVVFFLPALIMWTIILVSYLKEEADE